MTLNLPFRPVKEQTRSDNTDMIVISPLKFIPFLRILTDQDSCVSFQTRGNKVETLDNVPRLRAVVLFCSDSTCERKLSKLCRLLVRLRETARNLQHSIVSFYGIDKTPFKRLLDNSTMSRPMARPICEQSSANVQLGNFALQSFK